MSLLPSMILGFAGGIVVAEPHDVGVAAGRSSPDIHEANTTERRPRVKWKQLPLLVLAAIPEQKKEVREMSTIGLVGLGALGSQMGGRLLDSGNTVYGTNRPRSKAQERDHRWARRCPRGPRAPEGLRRHQHGQPTSQRDRGCPRTGDRSRDARLAPVSGSIPQAQAGTLAIMVGGTTQAFATVVAPATRAWQTVTHVGTNGQGLVPRPGWLCPIGARPCSP